MTLTSLAGCAADTTCTLTGLLGGDVSGEFAWAGVGEDECSLSLDRVSFYEGDDQLFFEPDYDSNFEWAVGTYDNMRVNFSTANDKWSSTDCGVAIDSFTREDWTRADYILVTGRIMCPPLTNTDSGAIELQSVGFSAYLVETF